MLGFLDDDGRSPQPLARWDLDKAALQHSAMIAPTIRSTRWVPVGCPAARQLKWQLGIGNGKQRANALQFAQALSGQRHGVGES